MARSSWKFNYINSSLYKYTFFSKFKNKKIVKAFCRGSYVPKFFLKKSILVHKGNVFAKIVFSKYHIGFKIGEFGVTRKPFNFPNKSKKVKR